MKSFEQKTRRRKRRNRDHLKPIPVPPALAAEWEAKLKASGFVDEENKQGDLLLPTMSRGVYLKRHFEVGNDEFYRLATHWMHKHRWTNRRERIWFSAWVEGADLTWLYAHHSASPRDRFSDSWLSSWFRRKWDEMRLDVVKDGNDDDQDEVSEQAAEDCERSGADLEDYTDADEFDESGDGPDGSDAGS